MKRRQIILRTGISWILGISLLAGVYAQEGGSLLAYYCPPCGINCDTLIHSEAGTCETCGMELVQSTREEQMEQIEQFGKMRIAMYIHPGMEILDFAGPAEVFKVSGFETYTVGLTKEPIISQGFIKIVPEYSIEDCPKPDIIAVFGGNGWNASEDERIQKWLQEMAPKVDHIYSVCTGAFFLAKAGLLDGQTATTFHSSIESLRETAPMAEIVSGYKYVDNGKIITAAGVSSGIEGALYLVSKLKGEKKAKSTAEYMEYQCWGKEERLILAEER
ncbi:MAG: DJ-1/PfpI family protein [Bacteroidota bacterium]